MRTLRPSALALALIAVAALSPTAATGQEPPITISEVAENFELVGFDSLGDRGMNAALAIHGDYAYIGSRTDGKADNLNGAGIKIVDISDPANLEVVGEMGPPLEGNSAESSRELRVWRSQDILVVLHTNCSNLIHYCASTSSNNNFRFYDISGDHAADPELILEFDRNTHEYFLWEDPFVPDRALLFGGSAGNSMQIWDISPVLQGEEPVTLFSGSHGYPGGGLHSLAVSNDGARAYFALLTGGFAVADVSDFTFGRPDPQLRRITVNNSRPTWPGPGAHSAIKLWDRDWAYASDEVYGEVAKALGPHGCPWGWGRMIDISDPEAPTVQAEYKLPQNEASFCETDVPRPSSSYSAHNPTPTPNLIFTTWHSGGVQAIDISDPATPTQAGQYLPGIEERPAVVLQEDPMLSAGQDKVAMWSFPIFKDGLIYVVDLRNGLYVLRYTGPHADEVTEISFLEGNSNQGDALRFEPPNPCERDPLPPGYEEQCEVQVQGAA